MKKNLAPALALLGLFAACGSKDEAKSEVAASEATGSFNSYLSDAKSMLPTCDASLEGSLGYVKSEKKLYLCESAAWQALEFARGANGAQGAPGAQGRSVATRFLSTNSPVEGGVDCKYGGVRVESGLDVDDNGALDTTEVGSRLYVCEGSINATARNHFLANVYNVGLVQTLYYCNANPVGSYVGGLGTGWIANSTTIVTNAHVVQKTSTHSCNGGPQALALSGIRVYFPKLGITADSMLRKGLPHAGGAEPNTTDSFDVVTIDAIDRTPEAAGASARADLSFLRMPSGLPAGRQALTLSTDNPLVDTLPNVPRVGDELFGIHYALGFGPRLAVSSIFQTFTCDSYQGANNGSTYNADTHCRSLTTGLGVSPGAHLTQINGYGDHGASGSPVFDRFGRVSGVLTWGQSPSDSPYNMLQSAYDVGVFLSAARTWNTNLSQ